jgi:hypothetical protein
MARERKALIPIFCIVAPQAISLFAAEKVLHSQQRRGDL